MRISAGKSVLTMYHRRPLAATVTVLTLVREAYVDAGVYARGKCAESQLLAGFTVDVNDVFDAQ